MSRQFTRDFLIEVAKGNIPGHSLVNKFGENDEIDSGDVPETVWAGGPTYGDYDFFPTSAQTMEAVSSDSNDTSAGTGARTVFVQGLDANFNLVSETITMNGTSVVVLSNTYIRMFRAYVVTAGSTQRNEGDITIREAGGGEVGAFIKEREGQTEQANYTIPAGKTGYLLVYEFNLLRDGGSNNAIGMKLETCEDPQNDGAWRVRRRKGLFLQGNTEIQPTIPGGISFPEKTDIRAVCDYVTANNMQVVCTFDILLVDN